MGEKKADVVSRDTRSDAEKRDAKRLKTHREIAKSLRATRGDFTSRKKLY